MKNAVFYILIITQSKVSFTPVFVPKIKKMSSQSNEIIDQLIALEAEIGSQISQRRINLLLKLICRPYIDPSILEFNSSTHFGYFIRCFQ